MFITNYKNNTKENYKKKILNEQKREFKKKRLKNRFKIYERNVKMN